SLSCLLVDLIRVSTFVLGGRLPLSSGFFGMTEARSLYAGACSQPDSITRGVRTPLDIFLAAEITCHCSESRSRRHRSSAGSARETLSRWKRAWRPAQTLPPHLL